VTKIVNLLTRMRDQLSEEKKRDEEIFEAMDCYCKTNIKEKNEAVEKAKEAIKQLISLIAQKTALSEQLTTEIEQLVKEVGQAKEAIATAEALRAKEKAEFEEEEADLTGSIESLDAAIAALSKHHESAFLSMHKTLATLKGFHKAPEHLQKHLQALLQSPTQSAKSYNSRSGEIFGILKQMQETFTQNLESARKEEAEAEARFDELVGSKQDQISKAEDRIKEKTAELAASNEAIVQGKKDLKDTEASLSADEQFLVDLADHCENGSKEYAERTASRNEELVGIGEALSILTDDSSRDLFGSSLGFIQMSAESEVRGKVVRVLEAAAAKSKNLALAALAVSAKLDGFVKVKAAIDEMITQLSQDQLDETTHNDWCQDALHENKMNHKDKTFQQEDETKLVNVLADQIETFDGELKALQDTVAENKVQVKRASEDREAANKEFQSVVADLRGTVVVLTKVLERLQEIYAPKELAAKKAGQAAKLEADRVAERKASGSALALFTSKASGSALGFLQIRQTPAAISAQAAGAAPPPKGFGGERKQNENSGGVLGLIQMTIEDTQRLEAETLAAEQEQQTAYTAFIADSAKSIQDDNRAINDKSEARATAEVDKQSAEQSLEATTKELADLEAYAIQVHASCDFVTKNYAIRQEGRAQEIESLKDAKAILSGAGSA